VCVVLSWDDENEVQTDGQIWDRWMCSRQVVSFQSSGWSQNGRMHCADHGSCPWWLQLLVSCMLRQQHSSSCHLITWSPILLRENRISCSSSSYKQQQQKNNGVSLNNMVHMYHERDEHCCTLSWVPPKSPRHQSITNSDPMSSDVRFYFCESKKVVYLQSCSHELAQKFRTM